MCYTIGEERKVQSNEKVENPDFEMKTRKRKLDLKATKHGGVTYNIDNRAKEPDGKIGLH